MNEKIQQARDVALGILKPSQKDLEHGLELHKNSVVCESYGFSPNSALDGEVMKAAMEAGASDMELQDMTEEMHMTRHVANATERQEYMEAWEAAGVTCIVQNAGEEGQAPIRMMKRLARFTYVTDMMRDFVFKATTPDDIIAAKKQNRHCLYMLTNGVPLTQDWISVEDELRYIKIFFQLGVRTMHLTYNRRNMIGDGCAEPANAGLSDFGRAVIAEMNRVGVIADVAHSGWQTSLEAAKASKKPMVASHSGCCAVNVHVRCKPDEVIRAIVDTGGYIGICCIPAFLGRNGDIAALLDHVDYVAKTFGVDHVTIGTDVAYVSRNEKQEQAKIPKRRPARNRWSNFWPPNDPMYDKRWQQPQQRESLAWTNWPLFTVGLVQRGYADEDIQKILGGNVLRVARAVLS
jgi:membrane dipeptidase